MTELQCADCPVVGPGVTYETWSLPPRPLCGDCHEAARAVCDALNGRAESITVEWLEGAAMDPAAVEAEPLPAVPGFPFMIPGNAALIVGPTGSGRSSLAQAGLYDSARAGQRGAYLGTEVTEPEFNARAADLADRRCDQVDDALRAELARVRYLNLASTIARARGGILKSGPARCQRASTSS